MNRQELFNLPFFKLSRRSFCDVNLPRFFSGWPYFILVLTALLMGSTKVSSQNLPDEENRRAPIQDMPTENFYSPAAQRQCENCEKF